MTHEGPGEESSSGDDGVTIDQQASEEVFGLLANGTRVEILRALGQTIEEPVSFSVLNDRVDVGDSGNFNYHLDRLLGTFVRKQPGGYELTHAGRQIVGAMHAGTYTADASVEPIRLDWGCLLCGGAMVATYEDEHAQIVCRECEQGARFPFPPGSLDQFAREELPGAFASWLRRLFQQPHSGFCHVCAGRTSSELASLPGGTEASPQPSEIRFECMRCGTEAWLSGTSYATYHPVVEGFLHERGFDTGAGHPAHIWAQLDRFETEILAEDPPRIEVVFEHDGERVATEIGPDAEIEVVKRDRIDD